jgi:hypothetical protein
MTGGKTMNNITNIDEVNFISNDYLEKLLECEKLYRTKKQVQKNQNNISLIILNQILQDRLLVFKFEDYEYIRRNNAQFDVRNIIDVVDEIVQQNNYNYEFVEKQLKKLSEMELKILLNTLQAYFNTTETLINFALSVKIAQHMLGNKNKTNKTKEVVDDEQR